MSKMRMNLCDCTITDYDKTGDFGELEVEHEVEWEIAGDYGSVTVQIEVDLDEHLDLVDLMENIDVEFEVDLAGCLEESIKMAVKEAEIRHGMDANCEALQKAVSEVLFTVARVVMEMYQTAAQNQVIAKARAEAEAEAVAEHDSQE